MAAPFTRVYTDEQRLAVAVATLDRKLKPLKHVVDLAERGELLDAEGKELRPFHMPVNTARALVQAERRRRSGRLLSALAAAPATSQAEIVRSRLMAIADHELLLVEKQIRRGKAPDMVRASRAAKVAREALALRAGSMLEKARPLNDQASQPTAASTPALARLAAERVSATAQPSPHHTQADEETSEPTQALAENGEMERINAPVRDESARFAPLVGRRDVAGVALVPGVELLGSHVDRPAVPLEALSVEAELVPVVPAA